MWRVAVMSAYPPILHSGLKLIIDDDGSWSPGRHPVYDTLDLRRVLTGVNSVQRTRTKRHRRIGTLGRCMIIVVGNRSINLVPPASTHHTPLPIVSAYLTPRLQDQQSAPSSASKYSKPETGNSVSIAPFVSRHPQTRAVTRV